MLSPKQFDKVMAQFATTASAPAHPTGTMVRHSESGRVGKVVAQHMGGKNVNVSWKRADVSVEPVHKLSQA